jgi:hypothetical protein
LLLLRASLLLLMLLLLEMLASMRQRPSQILSNIKKDPLNIDISSGGGGVNRRNGPVKQAVPCVDQRYVDSCVNISWVLTISIVEEVPHTFFSGFKINGPWAQENMNLSELNVSILDVPSPPEMVIPLKSKAGSVRSTLESNEEETVKGIVSLPRVGSSQQQRAFIVKPFDEFKRDVFNSSESLVLEEFSKILITSSWRKLLGSSPDVVVEDLGRKGQRDLNSKLSYKISNRVNGIAHKVRCHVQVISGGLSHF